MSAVALPPWEMRPLAEERYRRLGAQTEGDGDHGWLLAALAEAKAAVWDPLEQAAREDDAGRSGWEIVTDPAVCRREWLPYAAQLGGVTIDPVLVAPTVPDSVVQAQRQRALTRDGLLRGATESMVAAALAHMQGQRRHIVRERYDPTQGAAVDESYHLQIRIRAGDVMPGHADQLVADVRRAKPGGLVLDVVVTNDRDYDEVAAAYSTYDALLAAETDYDDLLDGS